MTSSGSWVLAATRFLLRVPPPRISRERAMELASEEMKRHGWEREPSAPVLEHLRFWLLYARDAPACGNMAVYIDMQDGRARAYTERGLMSTGGESSSADSGGQ